MSCKHCNFDGTCQFYNEESEIQIDFGFDDNGFCLVDEDPEPNCEGFESLYEDEE